VRAREILLTAIALLTASAVPAEAASVPSPIVVVNGGPGGRGVSVSTVARCPKGRKAVAGGYETSAPQSLTHRAVVQESRMVKGVAWRVTGFEAGPSPAFDALKAYVYCGKLRRALAVGSPIRTDFVPDPGQSTSSAAECPPHTTAFSGGFSAEGSDVNFFRSRRSGRFWEVGVTNVSGSGGAPYVSEAYCGRGKVITRSGTLPSRLPGEPGGSVDPAKCPRGTSPRSGGFDTPEPTGGVATTAFIFQSALFGKTWIATAASFTVPAPTVTGYEYCRA
jgi:hypothetical protein